MPLASVIVAGNWLAFNKPALTCLINAACCRSSKLGFLWGFTNPTGNLSSRRTILIGSSRSESSEGRAETLAVKYLIFNLVIWEKKRTHPENVKPFEWCAFNDTVVKVKSIYVYINFHNSGLKDAEGEAISCFALAPVRRNERGNILKLQQKLLFW